MGIFEREYRATAFVPASPKATWAVLVDLERYAEWNPFTIQVDSTLEPGTPVVMRVNLSWITLTQTEQVRQVVPYERLVWGIPRLMPWLLRAERVQTITPSEGGCIYTTVDTIGGLLLPLVHLMFGRPLDRGFRGVAVALAERVTRVG
ncbi:MAG: SRPBCC domain-containing protein [Myxococcota bacterium]